MGRKSYNIKDLFIPGNCTCKIKVIIVVGLKVVKYAYVH